MIGVLLYELEELFEFLLAVGRKIHRLEHWRFRWGHLVVAGAVPLSSTIGVLLGRMESLCLPFFYCARSKMSIFSVSVRLLLVSVSSI